MNNENKTSIIKITLISLGLLIVISIATVSTMYFLKSKNTATTNNIDNTATPAPSEMIVKYIDSKIINTSSDYTQKQDDPRLFPLLYKSDDKTYQIQINPIDYVEFYKKDSQSSGSSESIKNTTKDFLINIGFKNTSNKDIGKLSYNTFDSSTTTCQFVSYSGAETTIASYRLSCVSKNTIAEEYAYTENLLDIYKQSNTLPEVTAITRTSVTEGNKEIAILYITTKDAKPSSFTLIFAAIDKSWSYVGSRQTQLIDSKESFNISPELTKAINDPKYGGFLLKYVK